MKIYIIPILKGRYGLYCSSNIKSSGIVGKGIDYASRKWEQLSLAKPTTIKYKLYQWGLKVLDKVEHNETFFKSIPSIQEFELNNKESNKNKNDKIPIVYPKAFNSEELMKKLTSMSLYREQYHQKYYYLSVLTLPLTSLFSILPLPNIPFFYNAFRTYSHFKAFHGAKHLNLLIKQNRCELITEDKIDRHLNDLDKRLKKEDPELPLVDKDSIKWLAKDLDLPQMETEINRAWKQEMEQIKKSN
ncbi:hypothetical protein K502DRAFT_322433 [Neoconidiobolus thromboides FSU 785]|nr:hypothetical protein K502DRAFT_322433 [Neoconidiobolus thromboides FSU 785]